MSRLICLKLKNRLWLFFLIYAISRSLATFMIYFKTLLGNSKTCHNGIMSTLHGFIEMPLTTIVPLARLIRKHGRLK